MAKCCGKNGSNHTSNNNLNSYPILKHVTIKIGCFEFNESYVVLSCICGSLLYTTFCDRCDHSRTHLLIIYAGWYMWRRDFLFEAFKLMLIWHCRKQRKICWLKLTCMGPSQSRPPVCQLSYRASRDWEWILDAQCFKKMFYSLMTSKVQFLRKYRWLLQVWHNIDDIVHSHSFSKSISCSLSVRSSINSNRKIGHSTSRPQMQPLTHRKTISCTLILFGYPIPLTLWAEWVEWQTRNPRMWVNI